MYQRCRHQSCCWGIFRICSEVGTMGQPEVGRVETCNLRRSSTAPWTLFLPWLTLPASWTPLEQSARLVAVEIFWKGSHQVGTRVSQNMQVYDITVYHPEPAKPRTWISEQTCENSGPWITINHFQSFWYFDVLMTRWFDGFSTRRIDILSCCLFDGLRPEDFDWIYSLFRQLFAWLEASLFLFGTISLSTSFHICSCIPQACRL